MCSRHELPDPLTFHGPFRRLHLRAPNALCCLDNLGAGSSCEDIVRRHVTISIVPLLLAAVSDPANTCERARRRSYMDLLANNNGPGALLQ